MTIDPSLAAERELLVDAAERLLADREARYPALLAAGRLNEDDASSGLRLARAIVAQWRWLHDASPLELPAFDWTTGGHFGAPSSEIAAHLASVAERAHAAASGPRAILLADCYATMAELQRDGVVERVDSARIATRIIRERIAATRTEEPPPAQGQRGFGVHSQRTRAA